MIGHSAGAWGALALASEDPKDVAAIIAFAPGRGGHANDFPNRVCAPHTLMAAAGEFGKAARVKVTWLVAANDSYFSPAFSRQLARRVSWRRRQGRFSGAAGPWRRGALAGGNRGRGKTRGPRTRSRLEGATGNLGEEAMTLYFLVKYLHVARRDRHSRHRRRHRVLHADGPSQPGRGLHRAHG